MIKLKLQRNIDVYKCPICSQPLKCEEKRLVCDNGHSFDSAHSGYINLLVGGGNHGDDAVMMSARERFLSLGYYEKLAELVFDKLCRYACGSRILDAGCGEGYYTAHFLNVADSDVYGIDISKLGAKKSASGVKAATGERNKICVGSVYKMPYCGKSFDCIVNIFSPVACEEYLRVLKDSGYAVIAYPKSEHLYEMKEILYDEPYKKTESVMKLDGFDIVERDELKYKFTLENNEAIMNLFAMTPYYYTSSKQGTKRLAETDSLSLTASFGVDVYRKL